MLVIQRHVLETVGLPPLYLATATPLAGSGGGGRVRGRGQCVSAHAPWLVFSLPPDHGEQCRLILVSLLPNTRCPHSCSCATCCGSDPGVCCSVWGCFYDVEVYSGCSVVLWALSRKDSFYSTVHGNVSSAPHELNQN